MTELRGGSSLRLRATPETQAYDVAMRLAGDDGVRRTPTGLSLALPVEAAPDVARELVAARVDVLELTPVERPLEEVFLELTATHEKES